MKIKYRKDMMILYFIFFFHIVDCFLKEVYGIYVFTYVKNLMMLLFIMYCFIQKKIKISWFGNKEFKTIILMSVTFLAISIYQMMKNDTFNFIPFIGITRILMPIFATYYIVNIYKLKDITDTCKGSLCISFAFYILDLLLTKRFSLDAFLNLTLSTTNGVITESNVFSPLSMGLCIFLCANEKRNMWTLLSLIFVVMTNKRVMILYGIILFFFGQYFLKMLIKKKYQFITAVLVLIVTVYYIQMNLQMIDDSLIQNIFKVDLDSFGMGRAWLYRNIYNSNYKSAGFQTLNSSQFVQRSAEMDFPNMYLEMGALSILACVYAMFRLIRTNMYNYVIVTFVMVEMITSHFIDITYFWLFFYLTVFEINKSTELSLMSNYEMGKKDE